MALMRGSEVPEGAVKIDEVEAATYMWEIVDGWGKLADTWALRYAPGSLGLINAASGVLINNHYRNKLKLGSFGYMSSVIPLSLMPGMLTILFHRHSVSTHMLLLKSDMCPVCLEMRSAAIQLSLGIAYPMLLGTTTSMMLANRYATVRMPDLSEGPKAVFKFIRKITRPLSGTLVALTCVQVVASSVATYFEMRNNYTLRRKLTEIERKLEERGNK